MKRKLITVTLADMLNWQAESVAGLGLYGHQVRTTFGQRGTANPHAAVERLDRAIVGQANVLGWGPEALHHFMDSRDGRHLGDALEGVDLDSVDDADLAEMIRKAMVEAWPWIKEELCKP